MTDARGSSIGERPGRADPLGDAGRAVGRGGGPLDGLRPKTGEGTGAGVLSGDA